MSERVPVFTLGEEMVERATRSLHDGMCTCSDPHCGVVPDSAAARALAAAFDGVPMSNYAIGTLLQGFELVIVAREGRDALAPQVGVFRSNGDADGFDRLGHTLNVGWSEKPRRHISRVAVSKLDPPAPSSAERQSAGS